MVVVRILLVASSLLALQAEAVYVVYQNSLMWMDPTTGKLGPGMGGGLDYDVAVSPDRRTLYHVSGDALVLRDPQTLRELNPNAIVHVPNRLRWTIATKSSVALSWSGSFLYLLKLYSSPAEEDFAIATFDTASKQMLPKEAHLPDCQGANAIPLAGERQLAVVCSGDSTVHFLALRTDGSAASDFLLPVPPLPVKPFSGPRVGRRDGEESFVQSALSPDGTTLFLAKRDGRTAKIDIASRQVTAWPGARLTENIRVMPSQPCVSPDGSFWYLAARAVTAENQERDQIVVVDTRTMSIKSTLGPAQPFRSMAISPDGTRLYITAQDSGQIRILNSESGAELGVLGNERMKSDQDGPRFLVVTP